MSDSLFTPILPTDSLLKAAQYSTPGLPPSSRSSDDFKNLLTALLFSGNGLGGNTAPSGDLISPLLIVLLEQLISRQIEPSGTSLASPASISSDSMFFNSPLNEPSPLPWGQPVNGRLSQSFHAHHNGLDFAVPVGTPVRSTMDGRVVYAGWNDQGYGNLVIVENGPYRTYYAHLSSIPVSVGQAVRAGMVIGLSGNTGNSTGPHLHYEIRIHQKPIDPTELTLNRPPRWP